MIREGQSKVRRILSSPSQRLLSIVKRRSDSAADRRCLMGGSIFYDVFSDDQVLALCLLFSLTAYLAAVRSSGLIEIHYIYMLFWVK